MARKKAGPKRTVQRRPAKLSPAGGLTFEDLVRSIHGVNTELAAQAGRAVNIGLTLRDWLIGSYIAEYELHGRDRAAYGERLLGSLAAAP